MAKINKLDADSPLWEMGYRYEVVRSDGTTYVSSLAAARRAAAGK